MAMLHNVGIQRQIVIETDTDAVLIEHISDDCVTTIPGVVFGRHFAFDPNERRVWTRRDSSYVPLLHDGTQFDEDICRAWLGFDDEVNHGV